MQTDEEGLKTKFRALSQMQLPDTSMMKFVELEQFVHTVADEHR